jgi:K+-transporting ATPase KdpF subunit
MKIKEFKSFLILAVAPITSGTHVSNVPLSYVIGAIIACIIMAYLVYTLMHPEKF